MIKEPLFMSVPTIRDFEQYKIEAARIDGWNDAMRFIFGQEIHATELKAGCWVVKNYGDKLSVANSIKANALINVEDIFKFLISAKDDEILERYGSEERALECAEKYIEIASQVDLIEYPLLGWQINYTMPIKDSDERREYKACFYNQTESEE